MGLKKRVLIISNNSLDTFKNNGKTLLSFFSTCDRKNIAQLYFYPNKPNVTQFDDFFRITDFDIFKYRFGKEVQCGNKIEPTSAQEGENREKKVMEKIIKGPFVKLIRELWWNNVWKTKELLVWLDKIKPDAIFFMAGDSVYAYKICRYIQERYGAKLIVYITDDYVLPRKTFSLAWWIRRNYILKYMKDTVKRADLFLTISDAMQKEYKKIFNKDSIVASNMSEPLKNNYIKKKETILFVYAGGLHYGREKILEEVARAISRINKVSERKCFLEIYSTQNVSERIRKKLSIESASMFMGGLYEDELREKLNEADILVHVESFNKKNICNTKLSLSTKIPEYLSLGKTILAVGPEEIASMAYLQDVAVCVNNLSELYEKIREFVFDNTSKKKYGELSYAKYEKRHEINKKRKEFLELIEKL